MMDGAMYPKPWHPARDYRTRDLAADCKPYSRYQHPPRYYLIDFGISRIYDPNGPPPLESVHFGGDKSVPEFKNLTQKHNPFPTDVYYVGNIIRKCFFEVRTSLHLTRHLLSLNDLGSAYHRSIKGSTSWRISSPIWFKTILPSAQT